MFVVVLLVVLEVGMLFVGVVQFVIVVGQFYYIQVQFEMFGQWWCVGVDVCQCGLVGWLVMYYGYDCVIEMWLDMMGYQQVELVIMG